MTRKIAKTAKPASTRKTTRPMKVRLVDAATQDTRAVRFGTGCISPTLRK